MIHSEMTLPRRWMVSCLSLWKVLVRGISHLRWECVFTKARELGFLIFEQVESGFNRSQCYFFKKFGRLMKQLSIQATMLVWISFLSFLENGQILSGRHKVACWCRAMHKFHQLPHQIHLHNFLFCSCFYVGSNHHWACDVSEFNPSTTCIPAVPWGPTI